MPDIICRHCPSKNARLAFSQTPLGAKIPQNTKWGVNRHFEPSRRKVEITINSKRQIRSARN